MNAIRRFIDRQLGRGEAAITVPILDGPFLPNTKLDTAELIAMLESVDNLCATRDGLVGSTGSSVFRLGGQNGTQPEKVFETSSTVSALAVFADSVAVGCDEEGVTIRGGPHDGRRFVGSDAGPTNPTSMAFLDADTLLVTEGSDRNPSTEWRRDLMQKASSGSLWKLDLKSGHANRIAGSLAWAAGIAVADPQKAFVAESWRHRILAVDLATGRTEAVLSHLPAYPARIAQDLRGGFWLTFYSTRNCLVEFILREDAYRGRMLAELPEPYWMAPALVSWRSFREPLQGNQLRRMGVTKPFSETRSYGLVVHCDSQMRPLSSFHSRADGEAHGCVSACQHGEDLFVGSKGHGKLLRVPNVMSELKS